MIGLPPGVRIGAFNLDKIVSLWDSLKEFDAFFADDRMRDLLNFTQLLINPSTIVLEVEGGILWLCNINWACSGEAHFAFWNRQFVNREAAIRQCLIWAFLTFRLERIETLIAAYAQSTMRFVERKLGFVKEGVLRKRILHNGVPTDVHIFSILKDELFKGDDDG